MAARFELMKASDGSFYFHLKAANGQIILSSQMYTTKAAAENGIASVKTNAVDNTRYERRADKNAKPYFVLKAANTQIIGTSQIYASETAMEEGVASAIANGATAEVADLSAA